MTNKQTIPVLRIFDYPKAVEFYINWLGFSIDWEHVFEKDTPIYMQVSRGNITLHLSEHVGDATPGSKVFFWCTELKAFFDELQSKPYKYYRPGFNETFFGSWEVGVIDPFGNRLSFNEKKPGA